MSCTNRREHCLIEVRTYMGREVLCRSSAPGWHRRHPGRCCQCGWTCDCPCHIDSATRTACFECVSKHIVESRSETERRERAEADALRAIGRRTWIGTSWVPEKVYTNPLKPYIEQLVAEDHIFVPLQPGQPTPKSILGVALRKGKHVISQLKAVKDQIDRIDIEEMLYLHGEATSLAKTFETFAIPTPDWLQESQFTLDKEIKFRRRDQLEKQLKQAKSKLDALKSAEEKRTDAAGEVERLQKLLAG